jgi:serine phosphatase RsbU (regulator of sigma subunit)
MTAKEQTLQLPVEFGASTRTLPGQDESGDKYIVQPYDGGVLIGVVDGIGHGTEAAHAADLAITTLQDHAGEQVIALLRTCDAELRGTRGAVMCLAAINLLDDTMAWIGVGNVEAMLLRSDRRSNPPREHVLLRGGVLGYNLPALQAASTPIAKGDLLIFTTDGIHSGVAGDYNENDSAQQIADRICTKYLKGTDDALVLVIRYRKELR